METNKLPLKKTLQPIFRYLNIGLSYSQTSKHLIKKRYRVVKSLSIETKASLQDNRLLNHFKHLRVTHRLSLIKVKADYRDISLATMKSLGKRFRRVRSLHLSQCTYFENFQKNLVLLKAINQLHRLRYDSSQFKKVQPLYQTAESSRALMTAFKQNRLIDLDLELEEISLSETINDIECCRYPASVRSLKFLWGVNRLNFVSFFDQTTASLSHIKNLEVLSIIVPYYRNLITQLLEPTDLSGLTSLYLERYQHTYQDFDFPTAILATMPNLKSFGLKSPNSLTDFAGLFQVLPATQLLERLLLSTSINIDQKSGFVPLMAWLSLSRDRLIYLSIDLKLKWSISPDDVELLNNLVIEIYKLKVVEKLSIKFSRQSQEKKFGLCPLDELFKDPPPLKELTLEFKFIESIEFKEVAQMIIRHRPCLERFKLNNSISFEGEELSNFDLYVGKERLLKVVELPSMNINSMQALKTIARFLAVNNCVKRIEMGYIEETVTLDELISFLIEYIPSKVKRDVKLFWSLRRRDDTVTWYRNCKLKIKESVEKSDFEVLQYFDLTRVGIMYYV